MPKTDPIGIRFDPAERAALEKAAVADQRSMSALARKVLAEWLRKHGWLKGTKTKASNRARAAQRESDDGDKS